MSAAAINAKIDAAVAAQEAGDYGTALKYLRSAKMLLAAKPDSQSGDDGLTWDRAAIDAAITDLARLQAVTSAARSGSIRKTKIIYRDVDCDD